MPPETPTPTNTNETTPKPTITPEPVKENQPKPKKNFKLLGLIAAAIIVLLGAGAAAYYGVIVPNKPENKLRSAFVDLLNREQMTLSGTLDIENTATTDGFSGIAIDYTTKVNLTNNLFASSGTIGSGGAQFPYEMRYIDKDIYVKIGGLSSLDNLLQGEANDSNAFYLSLLSELDDQWYVIDRSFLQQAGTSATCLTDLSFALGDSDVDRIAAAYKRYPLFTIRNTSRETVDGEQVTKYELDPTDDQTAENFGRELESLEIVKKVKACAEDSGIADDAKDKVDDDSTGTFNAFVTDDGRLKKLELTADDEKSRTKMTMNFDFQNVEIEKPEGAKPIQEIFGELFGGGSELMMPTEDYETILQ